MRSINLYNTSSRNIEEIQPSLPSGEIRIYCCGPTVYNYAHIGNFRTFLVQDVLRRMLLLSGYEVKFLRNITDVDDKTIRGSRQAGLKLENFTQKWTDIFHADCEKLNMLPPDIEPKATEHIPEQIALIEQLIKKNHAYVTPDRSVYFRLSTCKNYGQLSGVESHNLSTQRENSAGAVNLADEYDRDDVRDFALWKSYKADDGEVFWESPWGKGRPGWHIECSAMALKYLGSGIDIHGGGIDLCFPHHENEIAQSESATGQVFVHHWFHSAHLKVDGQKMSKSLGNLFTLQDLIEKGYTSDIIRYCLISGHYRQVLNFTVSGLESAKSALGKLRQKIKSFGGRVIKNVSQLQKIQEWKYFKDAYEALRDDLNVPQCLGELFKVLNAVQSVDEQFFLELSAVCFVLGILDFLSAEIIEIPENIKEIAEFRWIAKQQKKFEEADQLRQKMKELGWVILDERTGYQIFPLE